MSTPDNRARPHAPEEVQKYRENAQWDKDKPTWQVEDLRYLLGALQEDGEVLDAGAGFGRNSAFLAEHGFRVKAVEIDGGAIPDLRDNILQRNVGDRVEVINAPIQEALHDIAPNSLIAVVDSGMSHYLSDEEKKMFIDGAAEKLKVGGMFTLLHFSENEPSATKMGRSKEFLQSLFGEAFEPVLGWNESRWIDAKTHDEHAAWATVFRKKGSQEAAMDVVRRAVKLKSESENGT